MSVCDADYDVLREYLACPHNGESVLEKFAVLPGAVRKTGGKKEGFVYIPGTRDKSVLLIAHADTVADENTIIDLEENETLIRNRNGVLGADDRAGCAMLRLLRETGHGLLVTDGEEGGSFGAKFMERECREIFDEINSRYQFMIQIDRCGYSDFKCYNVGTEEFRAYAAAETGRSEPDRERSTDIVYLCRRICGVNLSCGYYKEHSAEEYIVKEEWLQTLQLLRKWLAKTDLPEFLLNNGK